MHMLGLRSFFWFLFNAFHDLDPVIAVSAAGCRAGIAHRLPTPVFSLTVNEEVVFALINLWQTSFTISSIGRQRMHFLLLTFFTVISGKHSQCLLTIFTDAGCISSGPV